MVKKILSLLVIIAMLLSVPVFAEELYPGMVLVGKTTLLIPETGKNDFLYSAAFLSDSGELIPSDDVLIDVTYLPDGVKFDSGVITVFDYAKEGSSFTFVLTPPDSQPKLHQKEVTITLGHDLISNGLFNEYPEKTGWDTRNSSGFSLKNGILTFDYHKDYTATYLLTQEENIPLKGGELYEVSFDIKGGTDFSDSVNNVYSDVLGSSAVIYIENPFYPEWATVTVPLKTDCDGNFIFSLAITSEDSHEPLSIRNLSLKASYKKPIGISISIPQSFSVPKTYDMTTPLDIMVLDQEGEIMDAPLSFEALEDTENVKVEDGILTVTTGAEPGNYDFSVYITSKPEIREFFTVRITDSGIDNGNFESEQSDLSWLASGDGEYKIIRENRNSYASFAPNSNVGIMYNNAYVSFNAEENYVFKANLRNKFSDTHVEVTFIIEDLDDPDNLILCAYFIPNTKWNTYRAVFTPEEDINGRFIVAVNVPEGSDEQILYMDDIEVIPAVISAENVRIRGQAKVGNTVKGVYDFVNNFDGESATITNWGLSDNPDGPYKNLSYSNMTEIELTEDMADLYLRYEVTPMSLTAGILGETVYSAPIKVTKKNKGVEYKDPVNEDSGVKPSSPDAKPLRDNPSYISPVDISSFYESENHFSDLDGHWASKDINALAKANITSGYEDGTFSPDKNVTRAEFCALLVRALSLDEGIYKGNFYDVSPQSWYAGVIQTVYNCNLIKGIDDNSFSPNSPISKEQMITVIMRTFELLGKDASLADIASIKDFDTSSSYAKDYIKKALSAGIITGDDKGFLSPLKNTTRAEAATILCRFLKSI